MTKIERKPYESFQYNVKKINAMMYAQKHLRHFVGRGGRREDLPIVQSLEGMADFTQNILGFGFSSMFESYLEEHTEDIIKKTDTTNMTEFFETLIEPFIEAFENMGLLVDQVLLQQIIIMNVTTFEAYLKDTAISLINNNPDIRGKFSKDITDKIQKKLDYKAIEEYEMDLSRVIGQLLIEDWDFFYIEKTKRHYKRLLGIDNIYQSHNTENKFERLFAIRHIIIHNGGKIDKRFKRISQTQKNIGDEYKLRQSYTFGIISLIEDVVNFIEKRMDRMKVERI